MKKKASSRNLWTVYMQHMHDGLYILAPTAEQAARKAIVFYRKNDGLARPVVKEVHFDGTIDVF